MEAMGAALFWYFQVVKVITSLEEKGKKGSELKKKKEPVLNLFLGCPFSHHKQPKSNPTFISRERIHSESDKCTSLGMDWVM